MGGNLMNEDYVSFEVAKLLKEKGFDWYCHSYYEYNSEESSCLNDISNTYDVYAAPTLYMAQKWLREEKGIYVWVEPVIGHKWTVSSCDFNVSLEESDWLNRELHKGGYPIYGTFEEALQTGLLETLKLI